MSARLYPVPASTDEHRNLFGLVDDVTRTLTAYGYPPARGADFHRLAGHIVAFLYGPAVAGVAGDADVDELRAATPGHCPRCHTDSKVATVGVVAGRSYLQCGCGWGIWSVPTTSTAGGDRP